MPALLDRFTDGNNLCLIEALPDSEWNNLEQSAPSNATAWATAFFKGLDQIGGHGNPKLDTICWRGSEVLFCRSTFPSVVGDGQTADEPAWLRKVIEKAFNQDLKAILARTDLDPDLRSRLVDIAQKTTTPEPETKAAEPSPQPTVSSVPDETPLISEQSRIREAARDFVKAFADCCTQLVPQPWPLSLKEHKQFLEQFVAAFPAPGTEADAWNDRMVSWHRVVCLSCEVLADWIDEQPQAQRPDDTAQTSYSKLIRLAGLTEVRPQRNVPFSPAEHHGTGTLIPSASDSPGHVATVHRRGFKQQDQVLRKAEVLTFAPRPQRPSRLGRALVVGMLLGLVALATWWLVHQSAPPETHLVSNGPVPQATPTPARPSPTPTAVPAGATGERVQIQQFELSPRELRAGESVELTWDVAHAEEVRISGLGQDPILVPSSGSRTIVVSANTQQVILEARGKSPGDSVSSVRSLHVLPVISPAPTPEPHLAASASPTPSDLPVKPGVSHQTWEPIRSDTPPAVHIEPKAPIQTDPSSANGPTADRDRPGNPVSQPASAAYSGPRTGFLVWSGAVDKKGEITIEGNSASPGNVNGELPGVPVNIDLDIKNFAMVESPSASNGWKRMRIRSNKKQTAIILKWEVRQ